jgi:hypothetical protein
LQKIAYTFTPLTNGSFYTIISRFGDTDDYLFFLGPTFQWSVFKSIDLTLWGQFFYETAFSDYNTLIAAEIRWSF